MWHPPAVRTRRSQLARRILGSLSASKFNRRLRYFFPPFTVEEAWFTYGLETTESSNDRHPPIEHQMAVCVSLRGLSVCLNWVEAGRAYNLSRNKPVDESHFSPMVTQVKKAGRTIVCTSSAPRDHLPPVHCRTGSWRIIYLQDKPHVSDQHCPFAGLGSYRQPMICIVYLASPYLACTLDFFPIGSFF